jgi:hypothetical protein
LLIQQFWADCTFLHKSGFCQNFAMTSPETLYMKNVFNELRFLLVTHMTLFDIRFGRYGILKSGFIAGQTGYIGALSGFWARRLVKLAGV